MDLPPSTPPRRRRGSTSVINMVIGQRRRKGEGPREVAAPGCPMSARPASDGVRRTTAHRISAADQGTSLPHLPVSGLGGAIPPRRLDGCLQSPKKARRCRLMSEVDRPGPRAIVELTLTTRPWSFQVIRGSDAFRLRMSCATSRPSAEGSREVGAVSAAIAIEGTTQGNPAGGRGHIWTRPNSNSMSRAAQRSLNVGPCSPARALRLATATRRRTNARHLLEAGEGSWPSPMCCQST